MLVKENLQNQKNEALNSFQTEMETILQDALFKSVAISSFRMTLDILADMTGESVRVLEQKFIKTWSKNVAATSQEQLAEINKKLSSPKAQAQNAALFYQMPSTEDYHQRLTGAVRNVQKRYYEILKNSPTIEE